MHTIPWSPLLVVITAIGNYRLSQPPGHYECDNKNFVDLIVYSTSQITRVSSYVHSYFGISDFFGRCVSSDELNLSSICPSRSVYNYTSLEQFHQFITDLNSTFEYLEPMFDIGDLCYPSIQTYMCDYLFPPCVSNNPQAICEVSCNNYLYNGVCTSYFNDLLNYLNIINSTIILHFYTNCSESLEPLYGVDTSRHHGCNRLAGQ